MTRDEIKSRIASAINDDPDDPVFFTDTQLNELVDEAVEVIAEDTMSIRRTAIVAVRPGMQFIYTPSVASDIMAIRRIWSHVDNRRLTALSMAELDDYQERWNGTTGNPDVWFPVSWDVFGIWQGAAAGGSILRVEYAAWPRGLMDDDDEPELPEATQDAVALYGQYQGLLKKWDGNMAVAVLNQLKGHKSIAKGRTGISRMSARVFHRQQQPHVPFPSTLSTD